MRIIIITIHNAHAANNAHTCHIPAARGTMAVQAVGLGAAAWSLTRYVWHVCGPRKWAYPMQGPSHAPMARNSLQILCLSWHGPLLAGPGAGECALLQGGGEERARVCPEGGRSAPAL